jgi:YidC/Oxa1 family membrane protein insertase
MLLDAEFLQYESLQQNGGHVQLARGGEPLLSYRLATAQDTVPLNAVAFEHEEERTNAQIPLITFEGTLGAVQVVIRYRFVADSYVVRVDGTIAGSSSGAKLLIDLPSGVKSEEADTVEDHRHLAVAYKPVIGDAERLAYDDLEPGERFARRDSLTWVVVKNKYFLIGLLASADDEPFDGLAAVGGPRTSRAATNLSATVIAPIANGRFGFEVYAGPQEYRRLLAMGREFHNANPYGGWLQGVVQPFATIVMQILLWMRETFRLNYGWVLVIFGIAIRVVMWPLYQSSMRASIRMQRIQPEIMDVQKRYQGNPQKQQTEIMRIYREHGMTPFSPLMGCFPMLIPMPILIALFFVFQNTIEFRGVSFLWLPDISLKDPYYVIPVLMGASMFLLSWIGMRNVPPNPQAKVIGYFLPIMMTVFFLNFASGLNLYYAVQNIAAIPQQWLIANERAKAATTIAPRMNPKR